MPRTTGTNFTANGIQYLEASAGLAAELDGKAGMTTIFSCNLESFAVDGNHKMFGCSVLNSGASGTNDLFTCMQYAVDDDYMFKVHYVTGLVSAASIVTSVFDGTNYLFIGRRTNSPTEIDLESTDTAGTVQEWTGVGGAGVISSYAYKAVLGDPSARAGAAENAEAVIDHIAVFDTHLSDANVASLQSLWQAEEV
jgi:hypothetical protein